MAKFARMSFTFFARKHSFDYTHFHPSARRSSLLSILSLLAEIQLIPMGMIKYSCRLFPIRFNINKIAWVVSAKSVSVHRRRYPLGSSWRGPIVHQLNPPIKYLEFKSSCRPRDINPSNPELPNSTKPTKSLPEKNHKPPLPILRIPSKILQKGRWNTTDKWVLRSSEKEIRCFTNFQRRET